MPLLVVGTQFLILRPSLTFLAIAIPEHIDTVQHHSIRPGGIVCRIQLSIDRPVTAAQIELGDTLFEKGLVKLLSDANPKGRQLETATAQCSVAMSVEEHLGATQMGFPVNASQGRCGSCLLAIQT